MRKQARRKEFLERKIDGKKANRLSPIYLFVCFFENTVILAEGWLNSSALYRNHPSLGINIVRDSLPKNITPKPALYLLCGILAALVRYG